MPDRPPDPSPPRLDTLDADARRALAAAFEVLDAALTKLSGGAGFCEDRGYGWTLESEAGYRETIVDAFARQPVLRRLMHDSGVLLATGATIGDRPFALQELSIARAALAGRRTFAWQTGEGPAATRREIALGPVDVCVRTDATATVEHRFRYDAFAAPDVWLANIEGIGDVHWALAAVFARLRRYDFTCDVCTNAAGSIGFAANNARLESTSPLGPPASRAIDDETAARVQTALLANDFRVLHAIDAALVPAYCPACDRVYCPSHCAADAGRIACACGRSRLIEGVA